MEIGKVKIKKQGLESQVELRYGDAAALPYERNCFDAVTVAFGVRNFEDLDKGLSEISRVLKPNGMVFILEFSMPEMFPIKQAYRLYFKQILPKIGRWVSNDAKAYSYLPESVERFPKPTSFILTLNNKCLLESSVQHFSGGIASLYSAVQG